MKELNIGWNAFVLKLLNLFELGDHIKLFFILCKKIHRYKIKEVGVFPHVRGPYGLWSLWNKEVCLFKTFKISLLLNFQKKLEIRLLFSDPRILCTSAFLWHHLLLMCFHLWFLSNMGPVTIIMLTGFLSMHNVLDFFLKVKKYTNVFKFIYILLLNINVYFLFVIYSTRKLQKIISRLFNLKKNYLSIAFSIHYQDF